MKIWFFLTALLTLSIISTGVSAAQTPDTSSEDESSKRTNIFTEYRHVIYAVIIISAFVALAKFRSEFDDFKDRILKRKMKRISKSISKFRNKE